MLKLNSGHYIPKVGLGTWLIHDAKVLSTAVDCGYRHFDTAVMYGNEELVAKVATPRSEFFITSKILPSDNSYEGAI